MAVGIGSTGNVKNIAAVVRSEVPRRAWQDSCKAMP